MLQPLRIYHANQYLLEQQTFRILLKITSKENRHL